LVSFLSQFPKELHARERNPQNEKKSKIPAKKVVKFKAGAELTKKVK